VGIGEVIAGAVFLDRDGTLIDTVRDEETGTITVAFHPNQIRLLTGVVDGLKALRDAGYVFAIATNQPAPAKGQFSADAVKRTNDALVARLADEGIAIAKVAVCMHHPDGGAGGDASLVMKCDCRKPKPGLVNELLAHFGVAKERAWMIGDSAGDVEAGRAAGVRTGLVFASNRCELCPLREGVGSLRKSAVPDVHGATLAEIARAVLSIS
jgi:D-glycero-D-manno-heptose 1,7-bisphosphate phosphatase